MAERIFLSSPHMSDEGYELDCIHDAFNKNWIAPLGENVNGFEREMTEYLSDDGEHFSTALSSGTSALHLAVLLSGVKTGDKVFCQDLTFAASANPVKYVGGEPVFIDSERETWNMDPTALEKAIHLYGIPKAVVAVHLYGNPAKMTEILKICDENGIALIEDAAEALGSEYRGKKCGLDGRYGIFSFNGNKIITTSGGGMLMCRSKEDAAHALKLATQAREPFPWYQHEEIGFNYRMSNICAGIGRGQLRVLDDRIERKRAIFAKYRENLTELPLVMQPSLADADSNRWLSAALIDEKSGVRPSDIINALDNENIESRHLWKPMHSQPIFSDAEYVTADGSSVSDDLFARGICLPSDTKMTDADVDRVCEIIEKVFRNRMKG